jgi:hypothetical protein
MVALRARAGATSKRQSFRHLTPLNRVQAVTVAASLIALCLRRRRKLELDFASTARANENREVPGHRKHYLFRFFASLRPLRSGWRSPFQRHQHGRRPWRGALCGLPGSLMFVDAGKWVSVDNVVELHGNHGTAPRALRLHWPGCQCGTGATQPLRIYHAAVTRNHVTLCGARATGMVTE